MYLGTLIVSFLVVLPTIHGLPVTTPGPPSPTPPGCYYQGKLYQPGETIANGYDAASNWCYGSFCDQDTLSVLHWDNFACHTTRTTIPPTTVTPKFVG